MQVKSGSGFLLVSKNEYRFLEMRGKHGLRARGVLGPLASDFLLEIRGTQQHLNLPEFYTYAPATSASPSVNDTKSANNNVGLLKAPDISRFPDFVPRQQFDFGLKATYFPPHMSKGLVELQKRLRSVECVVEVIVASGGEMAQVVLPLLRGVGTL